MISQMTALAIMAVFPLCMIFATFFDLFTMTIPNKIVAVLLAGFIVMAPLAGMGLNTAMWHVGISLIVLGVCFLIFNLGAMGGGDAKLLAVSALWFGPTFTMPYLLYASLLGGLLTLIIMRVRRHPLPVTLLGVPWIVRLHSKDEGVPYGAALGPGALIVFPDTPWMAFIQSGALIG